jgi:hypothetical protein
VVGGGWVVVVVGGAVVVVVVVVRRLTCADGDPSPPHALSTRAKTKSPRRERRASFTANERTGELVGLARARETHGDVSA